MLQILGLMLLLFATMALLTVGVRFIIEDYFTKKINLEEVRHRNAKAEIHMEYNKKYELQRLTSVSDNALLSQKIVHEENMNEAAKDRHDLWLGIFTTQIKPAIDQFISLESLKNVPLTELIGTLNQIIDRQFTQFVLLPRAGENRKPPITNIQETTSTVAAAVLDSLEPTFMKFFKVYGLSDKFVNTYIVREIFTKVIEYMAEQRNQRQND